MQVGDTVVVVTGDERSHGDDVFRVVVLDGAEVAKIAFIEAIFGKIGRNFFYGRSFYSSSISIKLSGK
jgi:hypothetical protein